MYPDNLKRESGLFKMANGNLVNIYEATTDTGLISDTQNELLQDAPGQLSLKKHFLSNIPLKNSHSEKKTNNPHLKN